MKLGFPGWISSCISYFQSQTIWFFQGGLRNLTGIWETVSGFGRQSPKLGNSLHIWETWKVRVLWTRPGRPGRRGRPGRPGRPGRTGRHGRPGRPGSSDILVAQLVPELRGAISGTSYVHHIAFPRGWADPIAEARTTCGGAHLLLEHPRCHPRRRCARAGATWCGSGHAEHAPKWQDW